MKSLKINQKLLFCIWCKFCSLSVVSCKNRPSWNIFINEFSKFQILTSNSDFPYQNYPGSKFFLILIYHDHPIARVEVLDETWKCVCFDFCFFFLAYIIKVLHVIYFRKLLRWAIQKFYWFPDTNFHQKLIPLTDSSSGGFYRKPQLRTLILITKVTLLCIRHTFLN